MVRRARIVVALLAALALLGASGAWMARAQGVEGAVNVTVYVYSDGSARASITGPGSGGLLTLEANGTVEEGPRGCTATLEAALYSQYLNLQPPSGLEARVNVTQTGTVDFEFDFWLYANNGSHTLIVNGTAGVHFQDDGYGVAFDVTVNGSGWLTLEDLNETLQQIYSGATVRSGGEPREVAPGVYRVGAFLFYPNNEAGKVAEALRDARGFTLTTAALHLAIDEAGLTASLAASGSLDCSTPIEVGDSQLVVRAPSSFHLAVGQLATTIETPRLAAPSGDPHDTLEALSAAVEDLVDELDLEGSVNLSNIAVNLAPGDSCVTVEPQSLPLTQLASATVTVQPGCSSQQGGSTTTHEAAGGSTKTGGAGATAATPGGGQAPGATASSTSGAGGGAGGGSQAAQTATTQGGGGLPGKAVAAIVAIVVIVAAAALLARR